MAGMQLQRQPTAVEMVQRLISGGPRGGGGGGLSLADVKGLLALLLERKEALEQQAAETNLALLLHFLHHSRHAAVALVHPALWSCLSTLDRASDPLGSMTRILQPSWVSLRKVARTSMPSCF